MVTIGTKTGNASTMLSDLVSAMLNHGWSDADTGITNDQADNSYTSNGRALYHANSDTYLLLFLWNGIDPRNNNNDSYGMVAVMSTDWDEVNNVPAGLTTVDDDLPFAAEVATHLRDSVDHTSSNESRYPGHLAAHRRNEAPKTTSNWAASGQSVDQLQYAISVGNGRVNVVADNQDDTVGAAGIWTWEYIDTKFWPDGRPPVHDYSTNNAHNYTCSNTEFNTTVACRNYESEHFYKNNQFNYHRSTDFGFINNDPNDDSYFFGLPLVSDNANPPRPIYRPSTFISNQINGGANHEDTITSDGNTYRFFSRAGGANSDSDTISVGYRWD